LRAWIESEVQSWPVAVEENPHWNEVEGAKAADFEIEMDEYQKEVDMESDEEMD
jgi:hypothetical protein